MIELVGNLQAYELGLSRIGKSSKSKSKYMALKATLISLQMVKILR